MSKVLGEIAQRAELLDIRRLVQEPDVRGILSELWSQTKAVLSGETQRGSQGASNGREQDLVQAGLLGLLEM